MGSSRLKLIAIGFTVISNLKDSNLQFNLVVYKSKVDLTIGAGLILPSNNKKT